MLREFSTRESKIEELQVSDDKWKPSSLQGICINLSLHQWWKSHVLEHLFSQNVPAALYTDPNEIAQYLTLKLTDCEKLELPVRQPQTVKEVLQ